MNMLLFTNISFALKGSLFELNLSLILLASLCAAYVKIEKTTGVSEP
jgi:hypothetical protein